MKYLVLFVAFAFGLLVSGFFLGASVYAQSANTSATQTLGDQNTQTLQRGLTTLNATLGQLRAEIRAHAPPSNPAAVNSNLSAIRGTLTSINGTIVALGSTGRTFAVNRTTPGVPNTGIQSSGTRRTTSSSTPRLPNTGGGGARYLR